MQRLCSIFLYAFLADGLLSMADEASGGSSGGGLPLGRNILAWTVVFLAVIVYAGMMLSPRLARRILLLPAAFAIWAGFFGAMPLEFFGMKEPGFWLAFAQTALAACTLAAFGRWESDGDGWSVPAVVPSRPAFTWTNLGTGALLSVLFAAFGTVSVAASLCSVIERHTDGYIRIRPAGIFLEERRFRRGDQEVRLVSMMHIARQGFYDRLANELNNAAPAIVLLEGVTDRDNILKGKFGYTRLAKYLGISSQETSSFTKQAKQSLEDEHAAGPETTPPALEYRMADMDIGAFQPKTIAFIGAMGALLDSANSGEVLSRLNDLKSPLRDDSAPAVVESDIIDKRNQHLISVIQSTLKDHNTVVLPWGAEHMPVVQKQLEAWGFHEEERIAHPALTFRGREGSGD